MIAGKKVSMPLPQQDEFGVIQLHLLYNLPEVSMPLPQQDEFGVQMKADERTMLRASQCRFRSKMNSE